MAKYDDERPWKRITKDDIAALSKFLNAEKSLSWIQMKSANYEPNTFRSTIDIKFNKIMNKDDRFIDKLEAYIFRNCFDWSVDVTIKYCPSAQPAHEVLIDNNEITKENSIIPASPF